MQNLKNFIEDLKNELMEELNDTSNDFVNDCNYTESTYFDDAFHEFADANTDFYYSDLLEWGAKNLGYIEDVNNELGTQSNDIIALIQNAQYYSIYNDLTENLDNIKKILACDCLLDNINKVNKSNEDIENFLDGLEFKNIERLNDVSDLVTDFLDNEEAED